MTSLGGPVPWFKLFPGRAETSQNGENYSL